MGVPGRKVVVVVRPGSSRRRSTEVVRWIRALLPAAILMVAGGGAPPPGVEANEVITIDVDSIPSGPLSLADALARERGSR